MGGQFVVYQFVMFYCAGFIMLYILGKCLNVRVLKGVELFKLLIINIIDAYEK